MCRCVRYGAVSVLPVCSAFCSFIFFFKQKTAYEMRISDWSSDVCSSDLHSAGGRCPSTRGRKISTAGDSGSQRITATSGPGNCDTGKNTPERKTIDRQSVV